MSIDLRHPMKPDRVLRGANALWCLLGIVLFSTACGGGTSDSSSTILPAAAAPHSDNTPNADDAASTGTATPAHDDDTISTAAGEHDTTIAPPETAAPPPTPPRAGFDERGHLLGVSAVPYNPCANDPNCPDLQLKRAMMKAGRKP